jgi:hypothetical protein
LLVELEQWRNYGVYLLNLMAHQQSIVYPQLLNVMAHQQQQSSRNATTSP